MLTHHRGVSLSKQNNVLKCFALVFHIMSRTVLKMAEYQGTKEEEKATRLPYSERRVCGEFIGHIQLYLIVKECILHCS